MRGELRSARELASTFLREAEDAGRVTEAGVAHRDLGLICLLAGDSSRRGPIASGRSPPATRNATEEARERFGEDTGTFAIRLSSP